MVAVRLRLIVLMSGWYTSAGNQFNAGSGMHNMCGWYTLAENHKLGFNAGRVGGIMQLILNLGQCASAPVKLPLAILVAGFVWGSASASAQTGGDLRDVVKDLYGGDGITLSPVTTTTFHVPHFATASQFALDSLSGNISSSANLAAFNSTVSAFTFDIQQGIPVRSTESLGPLLAERAATIGEGKLNLAISFSQTEFKKFNGTRLNELQLVFAHDDCCGGPGLGPPAFERDIILVDIDLEIEQKVWAFFATLGLTERWDVGAVVPVVHVRAEATATATVIDLGGGGIHNFGPGALDEVTSSTGGEDTGFGDVIVRSKYNFLRDRPSWPDLAVVGQVTLPTGDENNLQGTGEAAFQGLAVASQQFGRWTPHLNLGYEISTDHERDNLRYVAGFDVKVHDRVTTAFDMIGRWEPRGDDVGDHAVDGAFGIKFIPFLDIAFNSNIIVPINDDSGLRPDFTWTVGAEYTF